MIHRCFLSLGTTPATEGITSAIPGQTTGAQGVTSGITGTKTGVKGTTTGVSGGTTGQSCQEMEYINTLIATNAVRLTPTDLPNKGDLVREGVDFTDNKPTIIIDIPNNGAIVRDVTLPSTNVVEVELTFKTVSGSQTAPVRGAPTSLPTSAFPTEQVTQVTVQVTKTTDDKAPQAVTLSVVACAEGTTPGSSTGKNRC
jgi:hypothetical protein